MSEWRMNDCIVYECVWPNDFSFLKLWHHGVLCGQWQFTGFPFWRMHSLFIFATQFQLRENTFHRNKNISLYWERSLKEKKKSHFTRVKTKENVLLYSNYLRWHLNPSRVALWAHCSRAYIGIDGPFTCGIQTPEWVRCPDLALKTRE